MTNLDFSRFGFDHNALTMSQLETDLVRLQDNGTLRSEYGPEMNRSDLLFNVERHYALEREHLNRNSHDHLHLGYDEDYLNGMTRAKLRQTLALYNVRYDIKSKKNGLIERFYDNVELFKAASFYTKDLSPTTRANVEALAARVAPSGRVSSIHPQPATPSTPRVTRPVARSVSSASSETLASTPAPRQSSTRTRTKRTAAPAPVRYTVPDSSDDEDTIADLEARLRSISISLTKALKKMEKGKIEEAADLVAKSAKSARLV